MFCILICIYLPFTNDNNIDSAFTDLWVGRNWSLCGKDIACGQSGGRLGEAAWGKTVSKSFSCTWHRGSFTPYRASILCAEHIRAEILISIATPVHGTWISSPQCVSHMDSGVGRLCGTSPSIWAYTDVGLQTAKNVEKMRILLDMRCGS